MFKIIVKYVIRIAFVLCLLKLDLFEQFDDLMTLVGYFGLSEIVNSINNKVNKSKKSSNKKNNKKKVNKNRKLMKKKSQNNNRK